MLKFNSSQPNLLNLYIKKEGILNTFSIKLFFSQICIVIFLHMMSFAIFEIKQKKNKSYGVDNRFYQEKFHLIQQ